ncbi:MAG: 6-pyruvoyl-tetrahydropterin synthase-related protein [Dehalococcoidales bacterium]|nr:6-pyruvoyl-tetrahydropterin synthase-related protein [Dehalococcoidales bacterium]
MLAPGVRIARPAAWSHRFAFAATALALLVLPVIAITPLLSPGLPASHDGLLHIFRAVQLDASLRDGDWYPRWAPDFAQGLGYPIFNYYAPLTYYLLVGLHWLGLSFVGAFKVLQFAVFLASGVGMYLFSRRPLGSRGALLAAVAYAYAPYHFADAYVRGDLAESLALAFFPFVLWAFGRLIERRGLLGVSLATLFYAGLILTHNLTAFFFTPLLVAYLVVVLLLSRAWRAVPFVAGGLLLALGLSAFYWAPALLEKGLVQIDRTLVPPFFDLHNNFVSLGELLSVQMAVDLRLANPPIPSTLGGGQLLLGMLGLVALALGRLRMRVAVVVAFFALATAGLLFLVTDSSAPLWDSLPLVSYIQFPWRLLGMASFAVSFVAGAAARLLPAPGDGAGGWRTAVSAVALGLLAAVLVAPAFVQLYPRGQSEALPDLTVAGAVAFERSSNALGTTAGEYLPVGVEVLPEPSPMLPFYDGEGTMERLNRSALPEGVEANLLSHRTYYDSYRFRSEKEVTVLFNLLYFPSWHAYVDGTEVTASAYKPYGLLTITVPAGGHDVEVRKEETPVEGQADAGSLASAGVLLLLAAVGLVASPKAVSSLGAEEDGSPARTRVVVWSAAAVAVSLVILLVGKTLFVDGKNTWFRFASPPRTVIGAETPLAVDLGGQVLCLGYNLDRRQARAGDTLDLRLYWEAQRKMETEYSVFVHVATDPTQPPVAQADSLHPANIATTRWQPGSYYADSHEVKIPADMAAGGYELIVGLYDPRPDGKRLPVKNGGQETTYVSLGRISVVP